MRNKNKFIILIFILLCLLSACFKDINNKKTSNTKMELPDEVYFDGQAFYFNTDAVNVTYGIRYGNVFGTYVPENNILKFFIPLYDIDTDTLSIEITCFDNDGDSDKDFIRKNVDIDFLRAPKNTEYQVVDGVLTFKEVSKATSYEIKYDDVSYDTTETTVEINNFEYGKTLYIKPIKEGNYAYTTLERTVEKGTKLQYFRYEPEYGYFTWHNDSLLYTNYVLKINDGEEITEYIKGVGLYRYEPKTDNVTATLTIKENHSYNTYYDGDSKTIELTKTDINVDVISFDDNNILSIDNNKDLEKELSYLIKKDDKEIIKGTFKENTKIDGSNYNGLYQLTIIEKIKEKNHYSLNKTKTFDLAFYPNLTPTLLESNTVCTFSFSDKSTLTDNIDLYLKENDSDYKLIDSYQNLSDGNSFKIDFEKNKYFEIKLVRNRTDYLTEDIIDLIKKYQFTDFPEDLDFSYDDSSYIVDFVNAEEDANYKIICENKTVSELKDGKLVIKKKNIPDKDVDLYLQKTGYTIDDIYYPRLSKKLDIKRKESPEYSFDYHTLNILNDKDSKHLLQKTNDTSLKYFYDSYEFEYGYGYDSSKYYLKTITNEKYTLDSIPVTFSISFIRDFTGPNINAYKLSYRNDYQLKIIINDIEFDPLNNSFDLEDYYGIDNLKLTYYLYNNKEVENNLYYLPSPKKEFDIIYPNYDFNIKLSNDENLIKFDLINSAQIFSYKILDKNDTIKANDNSVTKTKKLTNLTLGTYKIIVTPLSFIDTYSKKLCISNLTPKEQIFYKNGINSVTTNTNGYVVKYLSDINDLDIFTPTFEINNVTYDINPDFSSLKDGDYDLIIKDNSDIELLDQNYIFKFDDYTKAQRVETNDKSYGTFTLERGSYIISYRFKPKSYLKVKLNEVGFINYIDYEYTRQYSDNDIVEIKETSEITKESNNYYFNIPIDYGKINQIKYRFKGNVFGYDGVYYKYNYFTNYTKDDGEFNILPYINKVEAKVNYSNSNTLGYTFTINFQVVSFYLLSSESINATENSIQGEIIINHNGEETNISFSDANMHRRFYNKTGYITYISFYGKNLVSANDNVTFKMRMYRYIYIGNRGYSCYSATMEITLNAVLDGRTYTYQF